LFVFFHIFNDNDVNSRIWFIILLHHIFEPQWYRCFLSTWVTKTCWPHMWLKHVHYTCDYNMLTTHVNNMHVHITWNYNILTTHVIKTCSPHMWLKHVHYTCDYTMLTTHVNNIHVHITWDYNILTTHVNNIHVQICWPHMWIIYMSISHGTIIYGDHTCD
jgi:hypothetical protein